MGGWSRQLVNAACVAAAVVGLAPPSTAGAQVVYSNGVPDNEDGRSIAYGFSTANDFFLSSTQQLGSFQWWALHESIPPTPPVVISSYFWRILTDAGGLPGSAISTGSVTAGIGTLTSYYCCGSNVTYDAYLFTASLGNQTLGAGTYWLEIGGYSTVNPPTANASYYWATSDAFNGNQVVIDPAGNLPFTPASEGAFIIYAPSSMSAVPEPATLALLASGLSAMGGVGAMRRRKSRATPP
jgi:hypothetical protein